MPAEALAQGLIRPHAPAVDNDEDDGEEHEVVDEAPLDPAGLPCVETLAIPLATATDIVVHLRGAVLAHFDDTNAQRLAGVDELTTTRVADVTAELEERLRRHWPRKGKIEVTVRQAREGEVISHAQKLDRQCRKFRERQDALKQAFMDVLVEAVNHAGEARLKQVALTKLLPQQKSLAGVQGIQTKAKHNLGALKSEAEEWTQKLSVFVQSDPPRLTQVWFVACRPSTCVFFHCVLCALRCVCPAEPRLPAHVHSVRRGWRLRRE